MSEPKLHHFVPQFYLAQFANESKHVQVRTRAGHVHVTSISNVMAQTGFYKLPGKLRSAEIRWETTNQRACRGCRQGRCVPPGRATPTARRAAAPNTVGQSEQHHIAGPPFDESADSGLAFAHQQVAFPMTWHGTILHFWGTFADHHWIIALSLPRTRRNWRPERRSEVDSATGVQPTALLPGVYAVDEQAEKSESSEAD